MIRSVIVQMPQIKRVNKSTTSRFLSPFVDVRPPTAADLSFLRSVSVWEGVHTSEPSALKWSRACFLISPLMDPSKRYKGRQIEEVTPGRRPAPTSDTLCDSTLQILHSAVGRTGSPVLGQRKQPACCVPAPAHNCC